MNEKVSSPRFEGAVRMLGISGGLLSALSILSGVVMLLMKWADADPPYFLTWMALIVLPIGFLLLLIAIALLVARRKSV